MRPRTLRKKLTDWYERHRRDLPWRQTRDPYRIWVSEIMLQQTRVAAVLPYYERFLSRFSDVAALAAAPESKVLAAWAGLGYYSRARNLQSAAQIIVARESFPDEYPSIRLLPGVGDYTAAAIASIAFGLPHAVLDGNVLRVLSRLTNDSGNIAGAATRERLRATAERLLDRRNPGLFNQALMELGATICLPRQPQCLLCPIAEDCEALRHGTQNQLPVKSNRIPTIYIEKALLLIRRNGKALFWQREAGSRRLGGFWELPETLPSAEIWGELGDFRHSITNHNYRFTVLEASVRGTPKGFHWLPESALHEFPLSTTAKKALACSKKQVSK